MGVNSWGSGSWLLRFISTELEEDKRDMKTYFVELTTTLEVEAKSKEDAIDKAYEMIRDVDDMYDYEFNAYAEEK